MNLLSLKGNMFKKKHQKRTSSWLNQGFIGVGSYSINNLALWPAGYRQAKFTKPRKYHRMNNVNLLMISKALPEIDDVIRAVETWTWVEYEHLHPLLYFFKFPDGVRMIHHALIYLRVKVDLVICVRPTSNAYVASLCIIREHEDIHSA